MNKKEVVKIILLVYAIISTLLVFIAGNFDNGSLGPLIFCTILFILSLPTAYLYYHHKSKKLKENKIIISVIVIVSIILAIIIGLVSIGYYTDIYVDMKTEWPNYNHSTDDLDLSLSYIEYSTPFIERYSNGILSLNILFSYILFLLSFDDLTKKTNRTNYILTVLTSICIIVVNVNLFLHSPLNVFAIGDYSYARQYDVYFMILLGIIILHKFNNKETS